MRNESERQCDLFPGIAVGLPFEVQGKGVFAIRGRLRRSESFKTSAAYKVLRRSKGLHLIDERERTFTAFYEFRGARDTVLGGHLRLGVLAGCRVLLTRHPSPHSTLNFDFTGAVRTGELCQLRSPLLGELALNNVIWRY